MLLDFNHLLKDHILCIKLITNIYMFFTYTLEAFKMLTIYILLATMIHFFYHKTSQIQ